MMISLYFPSEFRSFLETVKDHVQIIFRAVAAGSTPVDNLKTLLLKRVAIEERDEWRCSVYVNLDCAWVRKSPAELQ